MDINRGKLVFKDIIKGRLVKRYKRFLADIELESGQIVTAHCTNSGSMKGCIKEGADVYISPQNRPERKLKYTWEMIKMPDSLVGINTLVPNKIAGSAFDSGMIKEFSRYTNVRPEITTSKGTRLDFLLENENGEKAYVELKNCTLVEKRHAYFPDAVTTRGQKHLTELERLASEGFETAVFFLIQRTDADFFSPADHIDPEYGKLLRQVHENGVKIIVYDTLVKPGSIELNKRIKVKL